MTAEQFIFGYLVGMVLTWIVFIIYTKVNSGYCDVEEIMLGFILSMVWPLTAFVMVIKVLVNMEYDVIGEFIVTVGVTAYVLTKKLIHSIRLFLKSKGC
jgi:hypothetical protein